MADERPDPTRGAAAVTVQDRLARLFPEHVRVAVRTIGDGAPSNRGTETSRRAAEYRAGRGCALAALAEAGIELADLGAMPDGAPAWPRGVVGSISHASGLAAAAVGWSHEAQGIGLDLAAVRPLAPDRAPLFAVRSELQWLSALRADARPFWALVLFAAKESFQKCARPILGALPDPHGIEIVMATGSRSLTARVQSAQNARWTGRFAVEGEHLLVATAAVRSV